MWSHREVSIWLSGLDMLSASRLKQEDLTGRGNASRTVLTRASLGRRIALFFMLSLFLLIYSEDLLELTNADYNELGIPSKDRRQIQEAIEHTLSFQR